MHVYPKWLTLNVSKLIDHMAMSLDSAVQMVVNSADPDQIAPLGAVWSGLLSLLSNCPAI